MLRTGITWMALCLVAGAAIAREQNAPKPKSNGSPQPAGYRAEFIADLDDVEDKITQLANAVPSAKYSWRPAPDVRSVSEVYMHIAGGNYFLATFVGQQPPADLPKDLEKVTDKAAVLSEMKRSFDHLRRVIANESDADLEKSVNMFGKPSTHRHVFSTIMNHLHEHLGQSIAYARMNGVVPPWSR
jgi:uncharacterized damage-inducible protein DinB